MTTNLEFFAICNTFFVVFLSQERILLDHFGENVVQGIAYARFCCSQRYRFSRLVTRIACLQNGVCTDMFQQKMEGLAMVVMAEMTQFMQENVVAQNRRKTHDIEI